MARGGRRERRGRRGAASLLLALALALSLPWRAAAEPPDPKAFRLRRLGAAEGLAQGSVYSLLQDRYGFLWLGTQDGLHRYDGYRFAIVKPDPYRATALPHGMVTSLLEDRRGVLWAGTFEGLGGTANGGATFERPLPDEGTADANATITALLEDRQGFLWVGTESAGLFRLAPDRSAWTLLRPADLPPGTPIHALLQGADGDLWLAAGPALQRLRGDGEAFETVWVSGGEPVRALREDRRGRLWVGLGGGGLLRFEKGRLEPRRFRHQEGDPRSLAGDDISALFADGEGRLWVGTLGRGLDLYDEPSESFVHLRHDPGDANSLSHDTVRSLAEDAGGLLWVGTAQGGATVINTRPRLGVVRADPAAPGGLAAPSVRAFLELPDRLLIGTDGGGLVERGRESAVHRPLATLPALDEPRIWSLYADRQRQVWIGGQNALHRYDPATGALQTLPTGQRRGGLGPGSVRSILQDEAGRLWVALFGGGLARLDDATGEKVESYRHRADDAFSLPGDNVLVLFRDRRDHLWVGTTEGLARRTADGRFHRYRHDPQDRTSLIGDVVRALHQDRSGNLWVGTDGGLNKLAADIVQAAPGAGDGNNRGFKHFTEAEGLPNNTVYAILEDDGGRLWLSTNRGLARFDPRDERFAAFGLEDGVQGLEYNGGAALRLADGRLLFGGVAGYNLFRPDSVHEKTRVPPVRFTEIEVLDRELPEDRAPWQLEEVALRHDDHVVSVAFAALDFTDPAANRYAYRLVGLDERWHPLGEKHDLSFTHLAAGSYRLEVRGANGDGVWNDEPASLRLVVGRAPWSSWWARLLYAAALLLVVLWLRRESRRRQALRREIADVTRISEERLNLALVGSGDGLWDWNIAKGEIFRSRIAEPLGWNPDELPAGHDFRKHLIHPEDQAEVEKAMQAHLRGEIPRFEVEYRMRDKWGAWRWILDRGTVVERDEQGHPLRMSGTFKDMTAHKEIEGKLRLWATVFKSIGEGVVIIDPQGSIQAVNPAMSAMTGWAPEEMVGRSMAMLESSEYPPETYQAVRLALEAEGRWRGELRQPRKDGSHLTAFVDFNAVRDEQGRLRHFVAVISDITLRKQSEEELRFLANYDTLTGLPNRTLFQQKLDEALDEARKTGKKVALLFGDLDRFKQVNDTLGHAVGDALLQEASKRLLASVRRVDTVGRLGGDEFTVLLQEVSSPEAVVRVAERILHSFEQSFALEGRELEVSTSLGISLFPDDGGDGPTLLKHADIAMYEAKEKGRNRYVFYQRSGEQRSPDDAVERKAVTPGAVETAKTARGKRAVPG